MEPIWYVISFLAFLLIFISILIAYLSQRKVNNILERYVGKIMQSRLTVGELSQILISKANLNIEMDFVEGKNSNVYAKKYKTLKMTKEISESESIIDLVKISQEIGFAILDRDGNKLYKVKYLFFPIVKICLRSVLLSMFAGFLLKFSLNLNILGLVFAFFSLGMLLVSFIFYLLTARVENKASAAVGDVLDTCEFITEDELFALKDILYTNYYRYRFVFSINILFFLNFIKIPEIH